jgi:hypothetical protein
MPGDLLLWCGPYRDYACYLAGPVYIGAFSSAAAVATAGRPGLIDEGSYVTLLPAAPLSATLCDPPG